MLTALTLAAGSVSSAWAERPSAPKLLPESTLAYVRIASGRELVEAFQKTSAGRMGQDEKIKPLLGQLYGSAADAFAQIEEQVGVPLDKLLALPQGEICVALVGQPEGPPAVVVLLEVGDQLPTAQRLMERGEQELANGGGSKTTEMVGDLTLHVLNLPEGELRQIAYFERDAAYCFATNVELAKELIGVWMGGSEVTTLAENRKFTSIMTQSMGTKDERPHLTWYVDPIAIVRTFGRGNLGAQTALALLPVLGLDGVQALGGSMIFATEEFDSIAHFHLLLQSPRRGVIEALALESGDMTPEAWVPIDGATYMTLFWNGRKTYDVVGKFYNQFRGEGAFSRDIGRSINARIGVELEKDLLDQFAGRVSLVQWFEPPVRVNSQTTLIGAALKDGKQFQQTLDKIAAKFPDVFTKRSFGGINYYQVPTRQRRRPPPENVDMSLIRNPEPCLGVVGDYLLVSDSQKCFQQALLARRDTSRSFATELDYKLVASSISRHAGTSKPSMIAFQRPEEAMRAVYELATSPAVRTQLERGAEGNPALRSLRDALRDNPLPPFSQLAKYLAPGGGMLINNETGIHYISFALKRE